MRLSGSRSFGNTLVPVEGLEMISMASEHFPSCTPSITPWILLVHQDPLACYHGIQPLLASHRTILLARKGLLDLSINLGTLFESYPIENHVEVLSLSFSQLSPRVPVLRALILWIHGSVPQIFKG